MTNEYSDLKDEKTKLAPKYSSMTGPHKIDVNINDNRNSNSSSPWWESKTFVTIITGLFATIIPTTTLILNHFENEAKKVVLNEEYKIEKARLDENFRLRTTENMLGKLARPDVSNEAKIALYTFLGDINKEDSGIAKFANDMKGKTIDLLYQKLDAESAILEEKQEKLSSYAVDKPNNDEQLASKELTTVLVAEKEAKEMENVVKSIQNTLITHDFSKKKNNTEEKETVSNWKKIKVNKNYSILGKLDTEISFKLYETRPTKFGSFGNRAGVIESGVVFKVKDKYVTFKGYKWLKIEFDDEGSIKSGWYSWENIRSLLVEEN